MKSVFIAALALILVICTAITLTLVTERTFEDMTKALGNAEKSQSSHDIVLAEKIFSKNQFILSLTVPDTMLYEIDISLSEILGAISTEEDFPKKETSRLICQIEQTRRQCGITLQGIF